MEGAPGSGGRGEEVEPLFPPDHTADVVLSSLSFHHWAHQQEGGRTKRDLVVILDFWHAAEYLADLAKALHPADEEVIEKTLAAWCHTMKQQGGQGIMAEMEKLVLPPRKPAVREQYETTVHYLRSNLQRMDYPTYLANGWFIGSGSIESACKTVVGQRLKLAGMHWELRRADVQHPGSGRRQGFPDGREVPSRIWVKLSDLLHDKLLDRAGGDRGRNRGQTR